MSFPIVYNKYQGIKNFSKLKRHSTFQISLVAGGNLQYYIGSQKYIGQKGDIFFIRPFDLHFSTSINNQKFSLDHIEFEREIIIPDYLVKDNRFNFLKFPCLPVRNKMGADSPVAQRIVSRFREIEDYKKAKGECYFNLFLTGITYLIILEIAEEFKNLNIDSRDFQISQRCNLNKVLDFIDNNYLKNISLKELTEIACLQKNYLCNLFKKYTGMPTSQYIIKKRLEHAIFLLNSTDLTITQVIYESGFENISYFYRCFRKYIKKSPSFFRNKK